MADWDDAQFDDFERSLQREKRQREIEQLAAEEESQQSKKAKKDKKKKKKKKDKKHKKDKKAKKESKNGSKKPSDKKGKKKEGQQPGADSDSSSDSDSDASGDERAEQPAEDEEAAPAAVPTVPRPPGFESGEMPAPAQRESWMVSVPKRDRPLPVEEEAPEPPPVESVASKRELNPYWKDGGDGMPEEQKRQPRATTVGDGGAGWRARALQRAKEQAAEEGRQLDEVVTERFESVEQLLRRQTSERRDRDRERDRDRRRDRDDRGDRSRDGDRSRESDRHDRERGKERADRDSSSGSRDADRDRDRDRRDSRGSERERGGDRSYLKDMRHQMLAPAESDLKWKRDTPTPAAAVAGPTAAASSSGAAASARGPETRAAPVESLLPAPAAAAVPTMTAEEISRLVAKALRAKLMGDTATHDDLQRQADAARAALEEAAQVKVVAGLDARGRPAMMLPPEQVPATRKGKFETIKDGERTRYFRDDDMSLDEMVRREKLGLADDYDANFARSVLRNSKFKTDEETMDSEQTLQLYESKSKRKSRDKQEEMQRRKAINAHQKQSKLLEGCWFCWDNPKIDKSLIVSLGEHTYLALPKRGALTPGHCMIVPMSHVTALNTMDEEVATEIQNFQSHLVKMFNAQKPRRSCIFIETVMELNKHRHTVLECIPMPMDEAEQAPIYFKKAIMESESEWSQHKKLISTIGKGIKRSIPPGFAYFHVEFDTDGGFAHVIEDDKRFSRYFGREVIAGMLDIDPDVWMRPKNETPEATKQKLKDFLQLWEPFDWTQQLDGGSY